MNCAHGVPISFDRCGDCLVDEVCGDLDRLEKLEAAMTELLDISKNNSNVSTFSLLATIVIERFREKEKP